MATRQVTVHECDCCSKDIGTPQGHSLFLKHPDFDLLVKPELSSTMLCKRCIRECLRQALAVRALEEKPEDER